MRILLTGIYKKGFTLIELIIVIFIISLSTALIMPSFWKTEESAVKSEAKRLSSTLRYLYDEAVGKKRTYVIKIDLNGDSWKFESEKESRRFQMRDNVMFKDVVIPSLGEVSTGEIILKFGPLGPEEPITLHLVKDKTEYTVMFNHINGRSKIINEYIL